MRIVSFFIRWIITLAILAGVVYVIGGQFWMALRLSKFVDQIKMVEDAKTDLTQFTRRCQSAPAASAYSTPLGVQLRFLDASNYQIELRCTFIESAPIVLEKEELPPLITKEAGSSGFYNDFFNPGKGTIVLRSLRATKTFSLDTSAQFPATSSVSQTSPATSCTGWGFKCCDATTQKGNGKQQTDGVTDCNANCFSACAPIPYFQGVATDPFPSTGSTIKMDGSEITVTFSYTASVLGSDIQSVHIDFGDGQSQDSHDAISAIPHTYSCPAGPCSFTATLRAIDVHGNSSVVNDATTFYIKRE